MLQCKVSTSSDEFEQLRFLGWRVKTVANGQAVMVKNKARCQKPRRLLGRQCNKRAELLA
jgi:hypothetical protein